MYYIYVYKISMLLNMLSDSSSDVEENYQEILISFMWFSNFLKTFKVIRRDLKIIKKNREKDKEIRVTSDL